MDESNVGGSGFSVAIVEDEKDLAMMYQMILTRIGVPVSFVAGNGADAVAMFKECATKPQIILMDNRLPKMSGTEATKAILDIAPDTRVIFLSADIGSRNEAISAGATLFISKPARVSDIIEAVFSARTRAPAASLSPRGGADAPVGSW